MTASAPDHKPLDARDLEIVANRAAQLGRRDYPDVGDYIQFLDGITRRVSHVYGPDWGDMAGVQTTDGGSFYLGDGDVSYSGSLYQSVPMTSLRMVQERTPGRVWIFHHDHARAYNGVDAIIPFRVWACDRPANR